MIDEHEALVEYSEMTSFDFNSKEFQEVRRDYIECRNTVSKLMRFFENIANVRKIAKEY